MQIGPHREQHNPMHRAFLLLILLACSESSQPYYKAIAIDDNLSVHLSDGLADPPTSHPYYWRFRGANITSVEYKSPDGERYDSLTLVGDALATRSKQHLLRKGPFGSIYTQITYYYSPAYHNQPAEFATVAYANSVGHDTPAVTPSIPSSGCEHLDGLSIVRVFEHSPGYLIASANYSSRGDLQALHVNGAKGGDWVHSNFVDAVAQGRFEAATLLRDSPKTRKFFGIPPSLPVKSLEDGDGFSWPTATLPTHLDLIYRHYDRTRCVMEESYRPDQTIERQWLVFPTTPVDIQMQSRDEHQRFGQPLERQEP